MKKLLWLALFVFMLVIMLPISVFAADAPKVDTGDTTFIIISTALVFIMTPGLAFFYGGMVRKKNVLNTMMSSFILIGIISVQWVLFGYTLAFGGDVHKLGIIGNFDWLGLAHVTGDPNTLYASNMPHGTFIMFQLMFAIITAAIITGSIVERMRFPALLIFIFAWSTLVYDPLAHWVWGDNGWLKTMGALDFAGGTVVHISSGIAGLTAAIVLGKRKGYKTATMLPNNIPYVLIGTTLLWIGWFGFNAGSALAANGVAINALIVTNTSAAAAMLSWVLIESVKHGKPTLLGACTGGVIGLVAITPSAGYVTPLASILIGLLVSPICYFFISVVKSKFGYDDSLDAFGCHGVGGIWGAIATGLFATKSVNEAGANGLFYGNPKQLLIQLVGIVVTIALSSILTFIILKVINIFSPIRVSASEEIDGLDTTQHGEDAYPDSSVSAVETLSM